MNYLEFLQILQSKTGKEAKKTGSGHSICCPAHDDDNPSLTLSQGTDGRILVHCFAGCTPQSICSSLGLEMSDLFISMPDQPKESTQRIYSYRDEGGNELFRKIRIQPGFDGKSKSFYCERVDENGQVIKSLKGCRQVLYRFPEVVKAIAERKPIFLVEGEKDAEKLSEFNLVATTAPQSTHWPDEFTNILQEADVIILYDMDKTGLERKEMLCKKLQGHVKRLRVVDLPELQYQESHGADVTDWLSRGHTSSKLLEIVSKTPDYSSPNQKPKIRAVTLTDFLQMELPKREMLLSPFLTTQGLCLLYAKRGVGKTHVALGIAYAVATGGRFLKWEAQKPRPVLLLDGEMPAPSLQERLRRISITEESNAATLDLLSLITPDLQVSSMPNLSTKEGQLSIEKYVEDSDLIIVDNLSCLFRSGIENDAESWLPAQEWGLELRRRGKSILFVHHAGKGGQQRGTSKKEDTLDAVICLKHPAGYRSEEGARFVVEFEKTRHFAGDDAASFEVRLREQKDGLWLWEIQDAKIDPEVTLVAELTKKDYTISQIMEETKLTKSQVTTRQNKAKELGLLD